MLSVIPDPTVTDTWERPILTQKNPNLLKKQKLLLITQKWKNIAFLGKKN